MSFSTYFNCKQNEKHDFLTLLATQSNYRHKNDKRGSGIRMSWVDFSPKNKKQGKHLFWTQEYSPEGTSDRSLRDIRANPRKKYMLQSQQSAPLIWAHIYFRHFTI